MAQVRPCVKLLESMITDSEFGIWEFRDKLRNYQPLQEDSTPWKYTVCEDYSKHSKVNFFLHTKLSP